MNKGIEGCERIFRGGVGSISRKRLQNPAPSSFSTRGIFLKVIFHWKIMLFCKIVDCKRGIYVILINDDTLKFCVQILPPKNNRLTLQKQISIHR